MSKARRQKRQRRKDLMQAQQSFQTVSAALHDAYRTFNSLTDNTDMDACIYEINALRSRRESLLSDIRMLEKQKLQARRSP